MSRPDDEYDAEDRPRRRRRDEYDDDDYDDPPRRRRGADLGDDPGMRLLLPVGQSGWAIAAGYLGLVSVLCLPGPLALGAGILALREIRRNPKKHGTGRAIFGIVMGGIATLVILVTLGAAVVGEVNRANR